MFAHTVFVAEKQELYSSCSASAFLKLIYNIYRETETAISNHVHLELYHLNTLLQIWVTGNFKILNNVEHYLIFEALRSKQLVKKIKKQENV